MNQRDRIAQFEAHRSKWRRIACGHLDVIIRAELALEGGDVDGARRLRAARLEDWTKPEGES